MDRYVLMLFLLAGVMQTSFADYRYYAWTYQFMTMLPGRVEAEVYNQLKQSDASDSNTAAWKRQYEIETGITPDWDISFYQVESYKSNDTKVKADEIKIRTRYKLAQKGSFILDPILYAEYKVQSDRAYPDKWETKLILARDLGKLNIAFNLIPEESYYAGTTEKYWKTEYAFGLSYPLFNTVSRIGLEAYGDITNDQHSMGPVLSFKGKSLWSAISPIYALNDKSADIQVQWIIGILF